MGCQLRPRRRFLSALATDSDPFLPGREERAKGAAGAGSWDPGQMIPTVQGAELPRIEALRPGRPESLARVSSKEPNREPLEGSGGRKCQADSGPRIRRPEIDRVYVKAG
ncbi:hypothetical protein Poly30_31620 [Planctomycetes bacterium Poly30]|uniref:Uncharacterized protein n=1 Tax=Saltatorellus ferox TaxID=2528018 RepID=A0A518EU96_9BACT|nr:hypothetical protein Poly30_31620 [Planctomycetes bacterium Poly30]